MRAVELLDCADNVRDGPAGDGFLRVMLGGMAKLRAAIGHRLGRLMMQGVLDHFDSAWAAVSAGQEETYGD